MKAGISRLLTALTQREEFNVIAVVDNDSTGHMWMTPDDKQAAKPLADLRLCWSATVFAKSAVKTDSLFRPQDANMRSVLRVSALQDIGKGYRRCLVKDVKFIGGTLRANLHIHVTSARGILALQRLQNMFRRKDSVFFILNSGSDALSKLLLPFVEAQNVLQRSSNIVERGSMIMRYTGWLYITLSSLYENEYFVAARLGTIILERS